MNLNLDGSSKAIRVQTDKRCNTQADKPRNGQADTKKISIFVLLLFLGFHTSKSVKTNPYMISVCMSVKTKYLSRDRIEIST